MGFRKSWKKAFGWIDNDTTKTAMIVGAAGALTGGLAVGGLGWLAGAAAGEGIGGLMGYQNETQKKAVKAQIASSEKIAQMQQNTVISAAPVPTQTVESAAVSEQNAATKKARAFRLANSIRGNTLGGNTNNKKLTLG